jgi:hypothetical protein
MTEARVRQRAKANAGQKSKKWEATDGQANDKIRLGQFDPGAGSIKSPAVNASSKNFAGARRGAARSR